MWPQNIKIFVCNHKPWYLFEDDFFKPIQVGKKNAKLDLWVLWDDTWDNISDKNFDYYAELTAQYRVRKNYDLSNIDYLWFCHYRRYMVFWRKSIKSSIKNCLYNCNSNYERIVSIFYWITWKQLKCEYNNIIIKKIEKSIIEKLQNSKCNIFLPRKLFLISNYLPLKQMGIKDTALRNLLKTIIIEQSYDYKYIIDKVEAMHTASYCNMFIMDKITFYEYAERMFGVLFKYEKLLREKWLEDLLKQDPMCTDGHRLLWFISERMLNLFVEKKMNEWKNINYDASTVLFTN